MAKGKSFIFAMPVSPLCKCKKAFSTSIWLLQKKRIKWVPMTCRIVKVWVNRCSTHNASKMFQHCSWRHHRTYFFEGTIVNYILLLFFVPRVPKKCGWECYDSWSDDGGNSLGYKKVLKSATSEQKRKNSERVYSTTYTQDFFLGRIGG